MLCQDIEIGDAKIVPTQKVRNLGIIFDENLNMKAHINNVCKSGFHHVRNLWKIRKFLSNKQMNIAAHAFVTSKLDYGNSTLAGAHKTSIKRLQMVQNAAARAVTKTRKFDHISDKMKDLHWLPVNKRIEFKINLITWKALNNQAPIYIQDLIKKSECTINLRSKNKNLLHIPKTKCKTMGDRAYSNMGPKLWNSLPNFIRSADKIESFKKGLKTFLFKNAYLS
jgi:hypothetical protein